MKKFIAALFASLMLLGLFSVATAQAEPGPNESNEHGLCTAYFNGQKKGHERNGNPGPFQALEDAAADDGTDEDDSEAPGEESISSDVYEFCQAFGIGGQPEHNGRYDCESSDGTTRDTDDDSQVECLANTGEGDTGGDHPSGKDK